MNSDIEPRLPYWPAALDQKSAAAYCGLSGEVFTAICPIQPIQFPARSIEHRYLRYRLDEWLSSLEAKMGPTSPRRDDDKRPFTPKMLAERWSCSERHIRNMIKSGYIPAIQWEGKLLRISWDEVDKFERGRTHKANEGDR